jgi:hypothetical protein
MFKLTTIVCGAALALCGCDKDKQASNEPIAAEPGPPPAGPPPADSPPVAARPAPPNPVKLTITPNAVGPLTKDSPASVEELTTLLPGYTVEESSYMAEGETYRQLVVKRDGATALEIEPGEGEAAGKIVGVTVRAPGIPTTSGIEVGHLASKLADADEVSCLRSAEGGEVFICRIAGQDNLAFYADAEDATVDPESPIELAAIAAKPITGIRWDPPI